MAVEWEWATWHQAVAEHITRRPTHRHPLRVVLPPVLTGAGVVWGVAALVALPRPLAVISLSAVALAGVWWTTRRGRA